MQDIKAVRFETTGSADVLNVVPISLAAPDKDQVLVRHEAIGVNYIDTYHRSGLYPVELPSGLGTEAAGIVEAVGPEVQRVKPGDRVVYTQSNLGAYSEAHLVEESKLIILPRNIDSKTAAGMMLKGLTAAYLLLKTYPIQAGEWMLIHAAAGGVGSILTQWAHILGARVIGTVGHQDKESLALSQGCDHVLLYRKVNVPEMVMSLTGNRGVDVVYDSVGKDTFEISLDSLKPRGMLVSYGNASGAVTEFKPLLLAQKGSLYLTRPTLAHYVADPGEQQELANALFQQVIAGKIKIQVNHEFSLDDVVTAHKTLESGMTTGSMVLIP